MTEKSASDLASRAIHDCYSFTWNYSIFKADSKFLFNTALNNPDTTKVYENYRVITKNNAINCAVITWCNFFGKDESIIHWKKLIPQDRQDSFRNEIYLITGGAINWKEFRKDMLDIRDKRFAHMDSNMNPALPCVETAFRLICLLHSELGDLNQDIPSLKGYTTDLILLHRKLLSFI